MSAINQCLVLVDCIFISGLVGVFKAYSSNVNTCVSVYFRLGRRYLLFEVIP